MENGNNGELEQQQQDLETGAYDNGNSRFALDRPPGIQRRRSLRRGGSVRVRGCCLVSHTLAPSVTLPWIQACPGCGPLSVGSTSLRLNDLL